MKENIALENRLKDYGDEAFTQHTEEVFLAVKAVCFCLEFLQNQENWSGRRAALHRSSHDSLYEKEEKSWEKYDRRTRREVFQELEKALKEKKWQIEEQDIPLKNFLRQRMMMLTEKVGNLWTTKDEWFMENQIKINGLQDYRAFLEAVYLLGFAVFFEIQSRDARSSLAGEYRYAEYFLEALMPYIPETGRTDYSLFCEKLLQEQKQERCNAMGQIMALQDAKLKKAAEEISLFRIFREAMENMEKKAFRELVKSEREEEWIGNRESVYEEDQESIRRKRAESRIRDLASTFAYGGAEIRQRLLRHLSGKEQMLVMEQWMSAFYPEDEEMLKSRIIRMAQAADLVLWDEYHPVVEDAMEKLLGRKPHS